MARKIEKCELSQLRFMDWCGERPFGHQVSHNTIFFWAVLSKTIKKNLRSMKNNNIIITIIIQFLYKLKQNYLSKNKKKQFLCTLFHTHFC